MDVTLRSSVPDTGLHDYVYGVRLPGLPREAMPVLPVWVQRRQSQRGVIDGEVLAVTPVLSTPWADGTGGEAFVESRGCGVVLEREREWWRWLGDE